MIDRRFGFFLATATAMAAATPAVARPGAPFIVTIAHADLDLADPTHQAALRDRVADAARRTCTPRRAFVTYTAQSVRACRARFEQAAEARIAERGLRHASVMR